ncbi:CidA/LrgA family protein [Moraxella haemolytica]|uniref:CidA/LrgA family protein n=1 Tax=Moraxella TaxID=475 RepID=UPI002542C7E1|nr:CidA/LrgA family protein [Moraxella sp. ZY171148]WII96197.1 CidA/LrgA family protein [Moraxella sp. ZY171148]
MLLKAFLVIFACLFLGQVIVMGFDLPLPASVIGLLLLFISLQIGLVKLKTVEKLAKVMLDHLVLLVIPACISIMQYLDVIADDAWILIVATVISTLAVLVVTGKSYEWLRHLQKSTKGVKNG